MTLLSSSTTLPPAPDPLSDAFPWLKSLPLAPTYYPTISEFEDPIGYIFKIEKEASQFGICKIVPPLPPPPKKTAIAYLNRSLLAGEDHGVPKFTTREQQIGFCPRRTCPVKRPVWQSGEEYSVQEFEAKAKGFEKHYLKKWAKGKEVSALEMETLFWKANADKPFRVEYANDMPGSAFVPIDKKKGSGGAGNVGDSSWNMRGVSRAKGSLLKFMKEEIPGVTSPMLYIAMMFSWFAWHVEDHDLHSLNYLHMGAGKTWYGVPREAAVAFEEVVRVHGYGEEVNALGTFSMLGEKTTVISPEVFISAGVPCCRLVQYAGEFVVTFPRAYHSGFSHGFNCGEAANIATPEWLRVARDAAIRRASINQPPMVSHFQLHYDLALSICSRISVGDTATPRSSRLKDKKKNEGETLVKELFVQNILRNNGLLHNLAKGSSVVLLPQGSTESYLCSSIHFGSQLRGNPRLSLRMCSRSEAIERSNVFVSDDGELDRINESTKAQNHYTVKREVASHCGNSRIVHTSGDDKVFATASHTQTSNATRREVVQGDRISSQRLFSCVTCGILTFDCVAIIQPKARAARHLMSADCSSINDLIIGSESLTNGVNVAGLDEIIPDRNSFAGIGRTVRDGLSNVPVKPAKFQIPPVEQNYEMILNSRSRTDNSALHLLAVAYGNSSDDEDSQKELDYADSADDAMLRNSTEEVKSRDDSAGPSSSMQGCHLDFPEHVCQSQSRINHKVEVPIRADKIARDAFDDNSHQSPESVNAKNVVNDAGNMKTCKSIFPSEETNTFPAEIYDEDSSRIHVFCLEHAVEVKQQLSQIGGVHMILLCHPEYPQVETEARNMAKEMGIQYSWNNISFRDSDKKDEDHIQLALDSQDAVAGNGDWAVKLGINLFYSANLSRSSLYCRQMPYNSVIYNAFGRNYPATSPARSDVYWRRCGRKKKVVAGKWCGKVWMSNQVHHYLVQGDPEDEDEKDDPSSHAWIMPNEKPERKPEKRQHSRANAVTRKSGKRKIVVEKDTDSDTSLNGHDHKRQRNITRALPTKSVEKGDANSADSPESSQPHRTLLKGRQLAAFSEDLVEDSLEHLWRKSKRKKSNFLVREEVISDDSMDISPYERHRNNSKSHMLKSVGSDDANSDDSFTLYPEKSRGKHAKFIERDNLSDDSIEYDSPHFMTPRGKHSKCIIREDTDSDDSLPGSSHPTNRNPRGRRAKYIEKRDALPDDSLEDNSPQQCKKIISKQANRVGSLDVVSDGSYEDSPYQQYRKSIRKKQKKLGNLSEQKQKTSLQNKHRSARRKQETALQMRHETSVQTKQKSACAEELETGPSTRLRTRRSKKLKDHVPKLPVKKLASQKSGKAAIKPPVGPDTKSRDEENEYPCDIEGCAMGFGSKRELLLHKKNICPVKGCGKKFFSHKYLVQHRKVHMDDRPLKCPWKGCSMTFKWPWARTEHIRVHTGARPYVCNEPGCGQTFRFVSDFSRHKRKTGHSAKKNSK